MNDGGDAHGSIDELKDSNRAQSASAKSHSATDTTAESNSDAEPVTLPAADTSKVGKSDNGDADAVSLQDIQHVLATLRTQNFSKGEQITREGEVEKTFHLLLHGTVSSSFQSSNGKRVEINRIQSGEMFGTWELMGVDGEAQPRIREHICEAPVCSVITLPMETYPS